MHIISRIYATKWGKAALGTAVGAGALLAAVGPVQAATLTASQINAITALLQSFNVEASTIANVRSVLSGQVISTTTAAELDASQIGSLRRGQNSRAVCYLQALLSADPDVALSVALTDADEACPFRPLTEAALKKFQTKHGLEAVGFVGPKTLEQLRKAIKEHQLSLEDDDTVGHGKKRLCAKTPPGHLIAPGWLKKHGENRPGVPECQKLPPGIKDRSNGGMGTTTASTTDTMAPKISNLRADGVASVTAIIIWQTDEKASSKVYYATSTPLDFGMAHTMSKSGTRMSHAIELSGLASSTDYYYAAISSDAAGNTSTSSIRTFTTE